MPVDLGDAQAYLDLDISGFLKQLKEAEMQTNNSTENMAKKLEGGALRVSTAMSKVGKGLTVGVTTPLATAAVASVKFSSQFETAMAKVSTIADPAQKSISTMKDEIVDLSNETGMAATDLAEATYEAISSGINTADAVKFTGEASKLAAAGFTSASSAVDVLTTILNAYGMTAENTTHISDVLIKTQNLGKTTVDELSQSIGKVIPTANAFGVSIEQLGTAYSFMTSRGIATAETTTYLNGMLNELAKGGTKVSDTLKEKTGKSFQELSEEGKSLRDVLGILESAAQEAGVGFNDLWSSQEAGKAALSLLGVEQEKYNETLKDFQDTAGDTEQAYEKMAETSETRFKVAVENGKNALMEFGDTIKDEAIPYMEKGIDAIEEFQTWIEGLTEEEKKNVVQTAAMVAGIGPLLSVMGKFGPVAINAGKGIATFTKESVSLVKAVSLAKHGFEDVALSTSTWYKGITSLSTAMGGMLGPMALVTAAVVAGGVAMTAYNSYIEEQKQKIAELSEEEQVLVDAISEQTEVVNNMVSEREKTIESVNREAQATQILADKLAGVVDENGRVLEGKEIYAQFLVGELSEAIGQEISLVDGQIQNYRGLQEEIQKTIENQRALAVQEAMKEDYATALQNQTQAYVEYTNQLQAASETQEKLNDAESRAEELRKKALEEERERHSVSAETIKAMQETQIEIDGLTEKLEKQTKATEDAKNNYEEYSSTIEQFEGLSAAILEGDAEKINMALLKIQEGFLTANTSTREALEEQNETIKEKYELMKEQLEAGAEGITQETVDQLKELSEAANAELNAKLEQDKQTLTTKFSEIGIQAPDALINSLMEKDPQTLQTVTTMLDNVKNGTQLKKGEIQSLFKELGIEAPNELISSLASKDAQTQAKVISLLTNVQNGTQLKKDQIVSLFDALGIDAPTSLINSLASKEPSVQARAISLLQQLQDAESSKRPQITSQLRDLGIQMDTNLGAGIDSKKGEVVSKAGAVGQAANEEIATKVKPNVDAPKINSITNDMDVAWSARNNMQSVFDNNPLSAVVNVFKNIYETVVDGSHANGLSYVPFNGYIAELHKGERVLTAEEAKEYNRAERADSQKSRFGYSRTSYGGDTFNFYNVEPDPYEYARQMKKKKKELLLGL